jgi:hypothetical protein
MKLNTLSAHLVTLFDQPMSEFTELGRNLRETSWHFDERNQEFEATSPDAANTRETPVDGTILKAKPGPGGGLEVDPFRCAFFILAYMIDGPRRETANLTWSAWHLSQAGSILSGWGADWQPTIAVCALTGQHLFGEALKVVLMKPEIAARVHEIRVAATEGWAEIAYDSDQVSRFEFANRGGHAMLCRVAVIKGLALQLLSKLIAHDQSSQRGKPQVPHAELASARGLALTN